MYLPVFETVITEMSLSWPYRNKVRYQPRDSTAEPLKRQSDRWTPSTYPEELLGSGNDVPDYNGCSEWIDDVFVIWVENESARHLAYERVRFDL